MIVLLSVLAGCATAPVQEMSDARQAIQAAQQAGAVNHAPLPLTEAKRLLDKAEKELELGDYGAARRNATSAKQRALKARQESLAAGGPTHPSE